VLCLQVQPGVPAQGDAVADWIIDDGTLFDFAGPDTEPSLTPTACPIQYSDVPPGSTFYVYVRCLTCRGVISGYSDGTFRPGNNVSRGQLAKIVSNAVGLNDDPVAQLFEDVAPGSTFYDFVQRLGTRGYMSGYTCGGAAEPCVPPGNLPYFRPGSTATRGQVAKIVSNAASFDEQPSGQTFQDMPPDATFYLWLGRLSSRGIVNGYPCGGAGEPCVPPGNLPYFRPGNNVTRGQAAKIASNTFFPGCAAP
jgi:hypothetical protein